MANWCQKRMFISGDNIPTVLTAIGQAPEVFDIVEPQPAELFEIMEEIEQIAAVRNRVLHPTNVNETTYELLGEWGDNGWDPDTGSFMRQYGFN